MCSIEYGFLIGLGPANSHIKHNLFHMEDITSQFDTVPEKHRNPML